MEFHGGSLWKLKEAGKDDLGSGGDRRRKEGPGGETEPVEGARKRTDGKNGAEGEKGIEGEAKLSGG